MEGRCSANMWWAKICKYSHKLIYCICQQTTALTATTSSYQSEREREKTLSEQAGCWLARGNGELWLADTSMCAGESGWLRNMENAVELLWHTRTNTNTYTHTRTHAHTHTHTPCPDRTLAVLQEDRLKQRLIDGNSSLLPPSVDPSPSPSLLPSSPLPPPPLYLDCSPFHFILSPSLLQVLYLSSHFTCIFSTDIHPFIPDPERLGLFFFFFYNLLDDNGKRHTTYCIIPASRYYTWQQWAHISVQNIQYDWLYWDKYSSKTQNESSVVWCFTRRGPLFFSSNTSIV